MDAHKHSAGSVAVVAGSYGMAGAAYLAAAGALAAGAGYIHLVCPEAIYPILAVLVPSAVFVPLAIEEDRCPPDEVEKAAAAAGKSSAAVIGPGLGESRAAVELVTALVPRLAVPALFDASALAVMARHAGVLKSVKNAVITPHPGEAAGLLRTTAAKVQADRKAAVTALAALTDSVAVLKGARTLVCDGKRIYENTSGNAGMAKAGTGDCLSGVIGAFLAEGLGSFDAACLGVYLHGKAGDAAAAAKGRGLLAADVVENLPAVIAAFEKGAFERGTGR